MSKSNLFARWQTISALFIAGFSVAAGLLVLFGWHTSTLSLLQINKVFPPVVGSRALWLLFCGIGLLASVMLPFTVWLAQMAHQKTREVEAAKPRFAGILEMAQDAIVSVDANRRITLFNQGAEKIFGYSASEVLHQPIEILTLESDCIAEFAIANEVSINPERRSEVFARRKNGSTFPAEVTMSWVNLGNEVIRTAMLRDVSRRKQAEEISAFLISIVNSSESAIIGNTLDGVIASWNRGAEKLYGYRAAEAIGKPISMLVPLNLNHELAKLLEQINGHPVRQRKIELSKVLEYTDGDMELLQNIIRLFFKTYPGMLAEIRQTIADNNGAGLARAAHSLKGIAGYFLTASDLGIVKSLERQGRELDLQNAKATMVALEQELTLIERELQTLLDEKAA